MNTRRILQELGLSETDISDIEKICDTKAITVKELLHQFLCDLIDNEYSGGSDECLDIANWFHRNQF